MTRAQRWSTADIFVNSMREGLNSRPYLNKIKQIQPQWKHKKVNAGDQCCFPLLVVNYHTESSPTEVTERVCEPQKVTIYN